MRLVRCPLAFEKACPARFLRPESAGGGGGEEKGGSALSQKLPGLVDSLSLNSGMSGTGHSSPGSSGTK